MNCPNMQKSLGWCDGKSQLPGIRRRLYYIAKSLIAIWPTRTALESGALPATYTGKFTLATDAKWSYIDVLVNDSSLTSEPQGEFPSQTQLNKLTAVHPGVGKDATEAANAINNSDNVYLVQDMEGNFRVVGSDLYPTKSTFKMDLGQGATGKAASTIEVEASDVTPMPFYAGEIVTADGTINEAAAGGA